MGCSVADNIITQKVGPLPLVVWVIGGSGAVLLFVMMSHKGNNGAAANATNQVSALAPTEAEAFGTIEQQQQDVSNALTTLGQNQSALGGSMSTLSGQVTQQGTQNAAGFQSLIDALSGVSGQVSGVSSQVSGVAGQAGNLSITQAQQGQAMQQYYDFLARQLSGVSGQVSGVSGQVSDASQTQAQQGQANYQYYSTLYQQLGNWFSNLTSTVTNGNAGLSQQVSSAQQSINSGAQANTAYLANLDQAGINATWSQYNNLLYNLLHPSH
jgi:uncharacterized protein YggU (UPF0235/DUF167 family)